MRKLLLLLSVIAILSSCKKYEDGPLISFKSRKERLAGKWLWDRMFVTENGVSKETGFSFDAPITKAISVFEEGGKYKEIYYKGDSLISESDKQWTWEFLEKDTKIKFGVFAIARITKLTDKEFHIIWEYGSKDTEVHFKSID